MAVYRKFLCLLLCLILFAPGTATALKLDIPVPPLAGVASRDKPALTMEGLQSGAYQTEFDRWYSDEFAGHDFMVRLGNELRLRMFHISPYDMIIGGNVVLGTPYIEEYLCQKAAYNLSDAQLTERADKIALLADKARALGKQVAVMITPNKAAFYEEHIPTWMRLRQQVFAPSQRAGKRFAQMLEERGVPVVYCTDVLKDVETRVNYPLFAQLGVHWNLAGGVYALQALCDELALEGIHLRRPMIRNPYMDQQVNDAADTDGYSLLNLLHEEKGTYVHFDFGVETPSQVQYPNILLQGDSYNNVLFQIMRQCAMGRNVEFIYYLNSMQHSDGSEETVDSSLLDSKSVNISVQNADLILLNCNECLFPYMGQSVEKNGVPFYEQCLQLLDHAAEATSPEIQYCQFEQAPEGGYRAVDTLNTLLISGRAGETHTLRLEVDIPPEWLIACDGAAELEIRWNGTPVQTFTFTRSGPETLELAGLPYETVNALDFLTQNPWSPQQYGGNDAQKLTFRLVSIQEVGA